MILGIGTDLVEVARIESALAGSDGRFAERVFTQNELEACEGRVDRVQALAARFAAKEACLKALGTGWSDGLSFRQVEILRAPNGSPVLKLHDAAEKRAASMGVRQAHVSLTHQPGIAGAFVVLEG